LSAIRHRAAAKLTRKPDIEDEWDKAYAPASEEYGNTLRDSIKLL
jgi:hypothetical protein